MEKACFVGTRILAPRRRYGEVVDTFAQMTGAAPVGDALDEATLIRCAVRRDKGEQDWQGVWPGGPSTSFRRASAWLRSSLSIIVGIFT